MFGGSEIETIPIAKKEREREVRERESDPKIGSNEHNLNRSWFEGSIDGIECAERTKWR